MARIQISDLPALEDISPEEMKSLHGGATAIEYGLIASLIGVKIITGVTSLGQQLTTTFGNVTQKLGQGVTTGS